MMKTYKAKGVVLHSVKYGENAMVLYLLTDLLGRQTYMVQGVRSKRGKGSRAALFQPMFIVDFVGLKSQKMEMHRMRDINNAVPLTTVPFDARKSTISLFMAEVLYRLIKEVEPNSPLFYFVCESIQSLDKLEDGVSNFHLWFLVRLSFYLGFYPGNEYVAGNWFDIAQGLFTPFMPSHRLLFNQENAKLLHELMLLDVEGLSQLKLSREQRSTFMTAIIAYFSYHLDTINQVKSIQILREVF